MAASLGLHLPQKLPKELVALVFPNMHSTSRTPQTSTATTTAHSAATSASPSTLRSTAKTSAEDAEERALTALSAWLALPVACAEDAALDEARESFAASILQKRLLLLWPFLIEHMQHCAALASTVTDVLLTIFEAASLVLEQLCIGGEDAFVSKNPATKAEDAEEGEDAATCVPDPFAEEETVNFFGKAAAAAAATVKPESVSFVESFCACIRDSDEAAVARSLLQQGPLAAHLPSSLPPAPLVGITVPFSVALSSASDQSSNDAVLQSETKDFLFPVHAFLSALSQAARPKELFVGLAACLTSSARVLPLLQLLLLAPLAAALVNIKRPKPPFITQAASLVLHLLHHHSTNHKTSFLLLDKDSENRSHRLRRNKSEDETNRSPEKRCGSYSSPSSRDAEEAADMDAKMCRADWESSLACLFPFQARRALFPALITLETPFSKHKSPLYSHPLSPYKHRSVPLTTRRAFLAEKREAATALEPVSPTVVFWPTELHAEVVVTACAGFLRCACLAFFCSSSPPPTPTEEQMQRRKGSAEVNWKNSASVTSQSSGNSVSSGECSGKKTLSESWKTASSRRVFGSKSFVVEPPPPYYYERFFSSAERRAKEVVTVAAAVDYKKEDPHDVGPSSVLAATLLTLEKVTLLLPDCQFFYCAHCGCSGAEEKSGEVPAKSSESTHCPCCLREFFPSVFSSRVFTSACKTFLRARRIVLNAAQQDVEAPITKTLPRTPTTTINTTITIPTTHTTTTTPTAAAAAANGQHKVSGGQLVGGGFVCSQQAPAATLVKERLLVAVDSLVWTGSLLLSHCKNHNLFSGLLLSGGLSAHAAAPMTTTTKSASGDLELTATALASFSFYLLLLPTAAVSDECMHPASPPKTTATLVSLRSSSAGGAPPTEKASPNTQTDSGAVSSKHGQVQQPAVGHTAASELLFKNIPTTRTTTHTAGKTRATAALPTPLSLKSQAALAFHASFVLLSQVHPEAVSAVVLSNKQSQSRQKKERLFWTGNDRSQTSLACTSSCPSSNVALVRWLLLRKAEQLCVFATACVVTEAHAVRERQLQKQRELRKTSHRLLELQEASPKEDGKWWWRREAEEDEEERFFLDGKVMLLSTFAQYWKLVLALSATGGTSANVAAFSVLPTSLYRANSSSPNDGSRDAFLWREALQGEEEEDQRSLADVQVLFACFKAVSTTLSFAAQTLLFFKILQDPPMLPDAAAAALLILFKSHWCMQAAAAVSQRPETITSGTANAAAQVSSKNQVFLPHQASTKRTFDAPSCAEMTTSPSHHHQPAKLANTATTITTTATLTNTAPNTTYNTTTTAAATIEEKKRSLFPADSTKNSALRLSSQPEEQQQVKKLSVEEETLAATLWRVLRFCLSEWDSETIVQSSERLTTVLNWLKLCLAAYENSQLYQKKQKSHHQHTNASMHLLQNEHNRSQSKLKVAADSFATTIVASTCQLCNSNQSTSADSSSSQSRNSNSCWTYSSNACDSGSCLYSRYGQYLLRGRRGRELEKALQQLSERVDVETRIVDESTHTNEEGSEEAPTPKPAPASTTPAPASTTPAPAPAPAASLGNALLLGQTLSGAPSFFNCKNNIQEPVVEFVTPAGYGAPDRGPKKAGRSRNLIDEEQLKLFLVQAVLNDVRGLLLRCPHLQQL